jgi:ribonuclease R
VNVQVSRVDLDGRRIDFRLVRPEDDLLMRAMRDKNGQTNDPSSSASKRSSKARQSSGGSHQDAAALPRSTARVKATQAKPSPTKKASKSARRSASRR